MTTLREAAERALDILEHHALQKTYDGGVRISNAAIALRKALAQPESEPVAYVTGFSKGYATVQPVDRSLLMCVGMALYRSPPHRKPLTDEELVDIVGNCAADSGGWFRYHAFARAIERAHGIGGEE